MAKQLFADKAATTMSSALSAGGTTFNVVSGAAFPVPTAGDYFYCTLYQKPAATEINIEIVKVTANSAGVFTLAQRDVTNITGTGGSGYAYPGSSGTVYVELRIVAKNMEAMFQASDLTATAVANTPAGNIAATTVQAAINELDTEKAALAGPNFSGTPQKSGVALATTTDISTAVTAERSATRTLTNATLDTANCKIGVLNGIMKMTTGAPAAATVRTDYAEPTTGLATGLLKNTTGTGAHTIAVAGTDFQAPIGTISGLAKGNGANALTAASAGVDFVAPGGALGTPASGTLTNCSGLPWGGISGTVPTWNQNTSGSAASLSATLVVASGGTGLTTPGDSGNVLTSDGTAWVSSAPASGGVTSLNGSAGALTLGTLQAISAGTKKISFNSGSTNTTSLTECANALIYKAGTYRVEVSCYLNTFSPAATGYVQVYKNGVAFGTLRSVTTTTPSVTTEDLTFSAGDTVQLFMRTTNAAVSILASVSLGMSAWPIMPSFGLLDVGQR